MATIRRGIGIGIGVAAVLASSGVAQAGGSVSGEGEAYGATQTFVYSRAVVTVFQGAGRGDARVGATVYGFQASVEAEQDETYVGSWFKFHIVVGNAARHLTCSGVGPAGSTSGNGSCVDSLTGATTPVHALIELEPTSGDKEAAVFTLS